MTLNQPPVSPVAAYPYFDRIQVWVRDPVDSATQRRLSKNCRKPPKFLPPQPARFDARFRQRIEFYDLPNHVMDWLASRDDHPRINQVEIAIDYVFATRAERDEAFEFLHHHLIRRWHGKRQEIVQIRGGAKRSERGQLKTGGANTSDEVQTRYDGPRNAPNIFTFYKESETRITGEPNCLHLECRTRGGRAVRAVGINSPGDLSDFSHRSFWQPRLVFVDIDEEQLGRLFRNQAHGTRAQSAAFDQDWRGKEINVDWLHGSRILRSVGSMQELLDSFGAKLRIRRILKPISNLGWLPEA